MDIIAQLIESIPQSARTPLTLLAFLAVIVLVFLLRASSHRLAAIRENLRDLPETDRRRVLEAHIGRPLPPDMAAADWLRYQTRRYLLIGFLCLLGFFLIGSGIYYYHRTPEETAVAPQDASTLRAGAVSHAQRAMELFHARDGDDNALFNMWLESTKQHFGTLASFRNGLNRYRAQLVEPVVQRRLVSAEATTTQGLVIFDSETNSGMRWQERIALVNVDASWRLASFWVLPHELIDLSWPVAEHTLHAYWQATDDSGPEYTALIPLPGWQVQTVGAPISSDGNNLICDVSVRSGSHAATMKSVYGGCGLRDGMRLFVIGVAIRIGETVLIEEARYTTAE